jgi:hypothetical protein
MNKKKDKLLKTLLLGKTNEKIFQTNGLSVFFLKNNIF